MKTILKGSVFALLLLSVEFGTCAPWMISGNEGKISLESGSPVVVRHPPPDSLTILDFSRFPPRVQTLPKVANSVIGPPSNIAIAPDGHLALIASAIRLDPDHAGQWLPDRRVHILDLSVQPPRIVGDVTVGRQPSGMSFTPDGRRALVANRADGTISVLAVHGTNVRVVQTLRVCEPKDSVSDVAIRPDGRLALTSVQEGEYLRVLRIDDDRVTATDRKLTVFGRPYRCVITPDGQLGLTAGQGKGETPDADALSVVDLEANPIRTVDYVPLGSGPESFEVSPDGQLVAAVVMNGSNLPPDNPQRTEHGAVVLLQRHGRTFVKVQQVLVGRIPEGVAFTPDGKYLVVQCNPARQLWFFAVHAGRLEDTGRRIHTDVYPSALRAGPRSP